MTKRLSILLTLAVVFVISTTAQKKFSVYGVGFYNQENLFDTCHDNGKNDYEYLPTGANKWDGLKYVNKLRNMSRALADMGTDMLPNVGCAIIGLSEVENENALKDLVAQPPLAARGYQFAHIEGADQRGVDCALIYNPSLFTIRNTKLAPYVYDLPADSNRATRGFLIVSGTLANEHVTAIVCHWPSRFSGSYYRELAGKQVRVLKDSLLRDDPNCKVFVMGDLNDDPVNKSLTDCLGAKGDIENVKPDEMYNPWYKILTKEGKGTLMYNGSWNLFDQIVMTPNLLSPKGSKDYKELKYLKPQIFRRDYLIQQEGKYKGAPLRTIAGGVWLNGYSDHLPVVVYLVKEQQ